VSKLIDLFIPGVPRPQGSLTGMVSKGSNRVFMKYPDSTVQHRNMLVYTLAAAYEGEEYCGAVILATTFTFPRPKSHFGTGKNAQLLKATAPDWHIQTPDADKLLRLTGDAVTIANIIKDDSQIVIARSEKRWTSTEALVGTHVQVLTLEDVTARP